MVQCDDCEAMLAYLRAVDATPAAAMMRYSAWRQCEGIRRGYTIGRPPVLTDTGRAAVERIVAAMRTR